MFNCSRLKERRYFMARWRTNYKNFKGGICNFRLNYDFFFKWLLNKVCTCFYVKGLDGIAETIDENYLKSNLILDGDICITDFDGKLYACIGNRGGQPDEYYVPTIYTIANPVLGSKQVKIGEDGVVIYNTEVDKFVLGCIPSGLYNLISQTATLLADNIISINVAQINTRANAIITSDSKAQATAAVEALKELYGGKPYTVVRQDILNKINVNPLQSSSNNIPELVELHNYIVGNFFQSIGIKSNNVRKKERVNIPEIESQNDYLEISVLEILTSWQKGFDEVNRLYGTEIHVELNPVLVKELVDDILEPIGEDENIVEQETENIVEQDNKPEEEIGEEEIVEEPAVEETEEKEPETIIEEKEEAVEDIIDTIVGGDEEDGDSELSGDELSDGDSE